MLFFASMLLVFLCCCLYVGILVLFCHERVKKPCLLRYSKCLHLPSTNLEVIIHLSSIDCTFIHRYSVESWLLLCKRFVTFLIVVLMLLLFLYCCLHCYNLLVIIEWLTFITHTFGWFCGRGWSIVRLSILRVGDSSTM